MEAKHGFCGMKENDMMKKNMSVSFRQKDPQPKDRQLHVLCFFFYICPKFSADHFCQEPRHWHRSSLKNNPNIPLEYNPGGIPVWGCLGYEAGKFLERNNQHLTFNAVKSTNCKHLFWILPMIPLWAHISLRSSTKRSASRLCCSTWKRREILIDLLRQI